MRCIHGAGVVSAHEQLNATELAQLIPQKLVAE
jgi:hypothetical protein